MERVQLSEDSLFIMNNLFNTIVTSFDVLRTYSQQSVIIDWLSNPEKEPKSEEKLKEDEVIMIIDIISPGINLREELDTKHYVCLVNRFLKICSDVITGLRGQFSKYVGDSVVGVFSKENIENSISASLEIQRLLSQSREKAASNFSDPEQILFAGIGIEIGQFTPTSEKEDDPQTLEEKSFLDFFGAKYLPKKSLKVSSDYGYESYEGNALEIATRLKRSTSLYNTPILLSEKVRNEFLVSRRKSLGLQRYPQDDILPLSQGIKRSIETGQNEPFSSIFVTPFAPVTPISTQNAPKSPITTKKELEFNLVGSIKVPLTQNNGEITE